MRPTWGLIVAWAVGGLAVSAPAGEDRDPDHGQVPGVVIDHIPASTKQYVGSPGIARLRDGRYVASHDIFGPGSSYSRTVVFASTDRGEHWEEIAELPGQFWSTLFTHREALYLIGTDSRYGNVVIRRSIDGGRSWTTPKDRRVGRLLDDGRYHCAPVPVVVHAGRVWRAVEDSTAPGTWGLGFRACMMSAPVDADLLDAESWTTSRPVACKSAWLDGKFTGWLEGNAVPTPEGRLVNILRVDYRPEGGKAAMVQVADDGCSATFDPDAGFIDFPGGAKKFTIRFDPVSKRYWSLTNAVLPEHRGGNPERTRNALTLVASRDLQTWAIRSVVLYHPDVHKHAFQYVDWLFEANDMIVVSRTAYDDGLGGARNQHDANYMTFHRIEDFRHVVGGNEFEP